MKKKAQKKETTPIELKRAELKKYISDINSELKCIEAKNSDAVQETGVIGDCLDIIEEIFADVEDDYDTISKELDEKNEAIKEAEKELEWVKEDLEGLIEINTMVGELKYKASNLLDQEVLDLFTQCIQEIKPAHMIHNLKTILQEKVII